MGKAPRKKRPDGPESLIGRQVVIDTSGPLLYLGTLVGVRPDGFWLDDADLRDSGEGMVTKERYACEAREQGIRANRKHIFVMARVVSSISALDDVLLEFDTPD